MKHLRSALLLSLFLTPAAQAVDIDIGDQTVRIKAVMHYDYTDYDRFYDFGIAADDSGGYRTITGDGGSDLFFSRIRIGGSGQRDDWKFSFEYEFDDDGDGVFRNTYLRYTGFGDMRELTFGKFKAPFGLESLTAPGDRIAIHRNSLNQIFSPFFQNGVMLSGAGEDFSYAVGLFEQHKDDSGDIEPTFVARYTYAPSLRDGLTLHLGAALARSEHAEGVVGSSGSSPTLTVLATDKVTFSSLGFRPVGGDGTGVYGSYAFAYDGYQALALELGLAYGPWHLSAEYMQVAYDQRSASDAVDASQSAPDGGNYVEPVRPVCAVGAHTSSDFDGYSLLLAYALTGETRPYDVSQGVFGSLKPSSPGGAWELFYRHSMFDSDNNRGLCDRILNTTYGVNWYLDEHIRMSFNFIQTDVGSRNQLGDEHEGEALALRLQLMF